jgi:kinesin family protein 2/24
LHADLLNSRNQVSVLEDGFGVVHVAGALEYRIKDSAQAASYIEAATSFRQTEKTLKNDASSRSHAICRIRIENPDLPGAEDGLLYLIDLAGSEAARDVAQHGAERMRETREINVSLSVLKDCIRGKAEADSLLRLSAPGKQKKKQLHVPFRQSTLTKVLKHVFDPAGTARCKTVVLACVNPCLLDIGASRNTLRYAEMLRVFVPKTAAPVSDPEVPMTWPNAMLRDWIDNNVRH